MTLARIDEIAACALAAFLALALVGAALLLAPGAAWGCHNSGTVSSNQDFSCTNAAYPTSIRRVVDGAASLTIRVPGGTGTGGTATVITGELGWPGIDIDASDGSTSGNYAIYAGTSGAIDIVDDTDTGMNSDSVGIRILQDGSGTATLDVRSGVTIGTSSSRMRKHGIYLRSSGSASTVTVTNAGTVYATYEGIDVKHDGPGTTTVTHSGTVNALNHGMWVRADGTGAMMVTSSGNITVTNANQQGIRMEASDNGAAMTLTATGGTITTPGQGIYMESRGAGAVTVQGTTANTGPTITSSTSHGIHIAKSGTAATAGDISITTTGGAITPAGTGRFHGIYVQDNSGYTGTVAIDNAADITAGDHAIRVERLGAGNISIEHSGGLALSRTRSGIFVRGGDSLAGDIDIDVTGGTVQAGPDSGSPAIRLTGRGDGDVSVTIAAGATAISYSAAGVFAILSSAAADDSQVEIEQNGRILGRSGVAVAILKHATAATPVARAAMDQPMIDIAWTGSFGAGTTAQTAPAGSDLLTAPNEAVAFIYARDAEASVASGGAWDGPAGIEAQVMSWSALAVEVAEGDDPGAFANAAAQQAAVPTGATAADNAYVKQFRAVLESDAFVVAPSILMAIGTTATTSATDLTDAQIVTYLRVDNAGRRTLLRNLLAQNLSDEEKAVLAALSTGDSDGLTTALNDADAGFSNAYKTAVRALLDRYNVGNIRVAMTGGTITSRGDGIRAYYATPHENNGAISVTVAAGTTVSGGRAGIWVANAGGAGTAADMRQQTVTVNGMVTGGTDAAVHLVGGGRLTVGATGVLVAGDGRPAVLVNDPGYSVLRIDGRVTGSAGADAALDLSGGGSVTVTDTGRVNAGGADNAILARSGAYRLAIYAPGSAPLTKYAVHQAFDRVQGGIGTGSGGTLTGPNDGGGVTTGRVSYAVVETVGDYTTGRYLPLALDADGAPVFASDTLYAALQDCPTVGQVFQGGACVAAPPSPEQPMQPGPEPPQQPGTPPPGEQPGQPGVGTPQQPGTPGTDTPGQPGTDTPQQPGQPGVGTPQQPGQPGTDTPGQPGQPQQPMQPVERQRPVERPLLPIACDLAHGDCRLYEALPSALLAMNRLPSYDERMAAARSADGGWARLETARGDWEAASSTQPGLAYAYDRAGVRAGIEMALGENARIGVAVRGLTGSADLAPGGGMGGGKIELTGLGGGVSATAMAGPVYLDAQAQATWYDVDIASATGMELKDGAAGLGYALALEAGRPLTIAAMGATGANTVTFTPRAGFAWSQVQLDDFTDALGARRVALDDATSLTGSLGLAAQTRTPGGTTIAASLDAMREFQEETETMFEATQLKASAEPTSFRIGLGLAHGWNDNRHTLQASAAYTAGGGDNSELAGALSLSVRF